MRVKKKLSRILAYRLVWVRIKTKNWPEIKIIREFQLICVNMVILCENEKNHALMHWNEFVLDKDQFK